MLAPRLAPMAQPLSSRTYSPLPARMGVPAAAAAAGFEVRRAAPRALRPARVLRQAAKPAPAGRRAAKPPPTAPQGCAAPLPAPVKVVGCGSCGVDYLASVAAYPKPDEKLRTDTLEVRQLL